MAHDSKQPLSSLEHRSRQVETAVEITHGKLKAIEDELAGFLDDYYSQVGADFEYLAELQAAIEQTHNDAFQCRQPILNDGSPNTLPKGESLKQFYRSVARECHPDGTQGEVAALKAEMMKTLNAAYARKNISEMWQIKWEIERQKNDGRLSHKQRLELLKRQQEQMQTTLTELEHRERQLRDSEAYQLMQHARLMHCCGQDFIAMVKGRVGNQIEQAKRELRAAKHQARYWGHVKVQRTEQSA